MSSQLCDGDHDIEVNVNLLYSSMLNNIFYPRNEISGYSDSACFWIASEL